MGSGYKTHPLVRNTVENYILAGIDLPTICKNTGMSKTYVNDMKQKIRQWGQSEIPIEHRNRQGAPRKLTQAVEEALREWMINQPHAYQDEACLFLKDEFNIDISQNGLSTVLQRMKWSKKQVGHYLLKASITNVYRLSVLPASALPFFEDTGKPLWLILRPSNASLLMNLPSTSALV